MPPSESETTFLFQEEEEILGQWPSGAPSLDFFAPATSYTRICPSEDGAHLMRVWRTWGS